VKSLVSLGKKQCAEIIYLEESSFRNHLLAMGCIPGSTICKLFTSPFGDPVAYSINGHMLSIQQEQAKTIVISEPN